MPLAFERLAQLREPGGNAKANHERHPVSGIFGSFDEFFGILLEMLSRIL